MIQLVVLVILFFVIFFGIAFILNMLLRRTWLMAFLYPIVILPFVGKNRYIDYVTTPKEAFTKLGSQLTMIHFFDIVVLLSGLAGTIISGVVIKFLRRSGYQMF